jgi:AAA domain, putative AbiEii toxin, Type IV TA system/AAA domain
MFFSVEHVGEALKRLESVHTFYCTTFLVLKASNIPVGEVIEFNLIGEDRRFMDQYYKPHPSSAFYYRVSRTSNKGQHWLLPEFPGKGLQKYRGQDPIKKAFMHDEGTSLWGWQPNYLGPLKKGLYKGRLIPLFHLAVWLYRERDFSSDIHPTDIISLFIQEFNLDTFELDALFDLSIPEEIIFQPEPVNWAQLRTVIRVLPKDAPAEEGGTLGYLELNNVGPASTFLLEPAPRINLITGDNGLGKTFLLECAWWALTGQWVDLPAYPVSLRKTAKISFQISNDVAVSDKVEVVYDRAGLKWPDRPREQTNPGLLIYASANNSFAVWDPAQNYRAVGDSNDGLPGHIRFSWDEIWDGKRVLEGTKKRVISKGLIDDWVLWQNSRPEIFEVFIRVLAYLSPDDQLKLEPGMPTTLPDDARDFPTLAMPYGDVAVVHASEGMRRIMALAYLIVWGWHEHRRQANLAGKPPQQRMVLLIDELEAHLHPKWQRVILPALLNVQAALDPQLKIQFLIATHSPIILTSVEPFFDENIDQLFHLELVKKGLFDEVQLEATLFQRQGTADDWSRSHIFDETPSRSVPASQAIEDAIALQESENPTKADVRRVTDLLLQTLSANDNFWPRWLSWAEQYGVQF